MIWTAEMDAFVTAKRAESLSFSAIAALMKMPRCGVISRARRKNLCPMVNPSIKRKVVLATGESVWIGPPRRKRNRTVSLATAAALQPLPPPVKPVVRYEGKSLGVADLKSHHCRYPFGHVGEPGFHFCGTERDGLSPYCAEHHALTSTPFQRTVKK